MSTLIDITGHQFGRLLALEPSYTRKGRKYWVCQCNCGNKKTVSSKYLLRGTVHSCGCLRHGFWGTKIHRIWNGMLNRCGNKNSKDYKRYGGRGITVCERWKNFENFLSDMGDCPAGRSLDRINNDRGYEPTNCRWATPAEQACNRRKVAVVEKFTDDELVNELLRRGYFVSRL